MTKIKILLCVSLLAWSPISFAWHIADVAVLVPLANSEERMALQLTPFAEGRHGPLLPNFLGAQLLDLVPQMSNEEVWPSLAVVGIRVDPCFIEGYGPQRCQAQIRLVWQPVVKRGVRLIESRDAAVHSFYNLTKRQFEAFLRDWQTVSAEGFAPVLGVHPRLAAEGLEGATWAQMKTILQNHTGVERLVRVTQMNVLAGEQIWTFAGFDIRGGEIRYISIPGVDLESQGVIQGATNNQVFTGRMVPEMDTPLGKFIENSREFSYYSEGQIQALIQEVADIENPAKHNSGTVDCASCHMAHSVHQWLSLNVLLQNYPVDWGVVPLMVEGPVRPNQLRAMGYFSRWPVISTRTLTESQESLGHLLQR